MLRGAALKRAAGAIIVVAIGALSGCGEDPGPDGAGSLEPKEFPDWPSYGHDHSNSRSNPYERKITPGNVATLVEKWSFSDVAVTSTPVVFDGTIYFGDWHADVQARDARTGEARWPAKDLQDSTVIPNQINHTPAVTKDYVYIGAHGAEMYKLYRRTGEILQQKKIDDQTSLMLWSSPVLIDDLIIIGVGSYQVFIPATPAFQGNIVGLDAETLEVKWRLPLAEDSSGISVWSSAAVDTDRKLAFIGTGQQYAEGSDSPYSDALVAIQSRRVPHRRPASPCSRRAPGRRR